MEIARTRQNSKLQGAAETSAVNAAKGKFFALMQTPN